MKLIRFQLSTAIEFDSHVYDHTFYLRCVPVESARQRILAAGVNLVPQVPYTASHDGFGNTVLSGHIRESHLSFAYAVAGEAIIQPEAHETRGLRGVFSAFTDLTKPSGQLISLHSSLNLSGDVTRDSAVISEAIHSSMVYADTGSGTQKTAAEAFEEGCGVCQDYSHIFLCLARLSGMPARFVNGLVAGENVPHAWVQVWDNEWIDVDPTRRTINGEDYVAFSIGRDFSDCPVERGVFYGDGRKITATSVDVTAEPFPAIITSQQT